MSSKEELLKLLFFYSSDYISAQTLSRRLGVRQSTVYKYIEELRKEGFEISGCTNRGYMLGAADDPLSAEEIVKFYPMPKEKIRIFSCLPSTNTTAKEMATCGAPEGTVCIAEKQTRGRGRMDRQFYSPEGTGLYMSFILRPTLSPKDALHLTTIAAVAVAETAEALLCDTVDIKWVNDVYYKGKKVCGILTESAFDEKGNLSYVIVGIGVNLLSPKGGFPTPIENIAGSLLEAPLKSARSRLAAGILERFFAYYTHFKDKAYIEPYKKRSFLTGRTVEVLCGDARYPAKVLGIEDDLALSVELSDGTVKKLASGEVSILPNIEK